MGRVEIDMALMTTAEVKSILGITTSEYDTNIAFFIPFVEKRFN